MSGNTLIVAAATFALVAGGAVAEGFRPKAELETVHGTFRSAAPEEWYGGFGTREIVFADGRWSLVFTHALDPEMTLRMFQVRAGGPYEIREPSPAVAGAYHAVFHEDWKHMTLLTDDPQTIEAMDMSECGLPPNLEVDISASGCAALRPIAECGETHDLFAMDETVRPPDNDMCSADRLPTALLPVVARY